MGKLYLLRHLKSKWNEENRFAGWTDGPLSDEGIIGAKEMSERLFKNKIDLIYSSVLFRNMCTVSEILKYQGKYPIFVHLDPGKMKSWGEYAEIGRNDVKVFVSEKLNERYYGKIQGMDKKETAEKFGEEKVQKWRRSYKIPPPGGESLKAVYKRVVPFFKKNIEPELKNGKSVLIVASHNSLRALSKFAKNIPDDKIADFEISYGELLEVEMK